MYESEEIDKTEYYFISTGEEYGDLKILMITNSSDTIVFDNSSVCTKIHTYVKFVYYITKQNITDENGNVITDAWIQPDKENNCVKVTWYKNTN